MNKNNSYPYDQPPPYTPGPQETTYVHNVLHNSPQVVHVRPIPLGPKSQTILCPSCHATIQTELRYETSSKTHLMALLLCLLFWPVACIPYCMDSCQSANHYCPNCGAYIGTYDNN
ncbi:lipopolysaccharide-induced tumor necrosis factor-alpha factor homolog [Condylostylus longicornis]|uniref:lipopolysaccharide-induced tumor necrosis factor-alpha factor homolog n=1 Tax=Condylostylus longicornis TaxID=2530218 RepID=UPI00244DEBE6|nr:lipopolysaccharide-induced tumor necrosis factor-alpha factor homolog [Condylostylus longicornis]